MTQDFVDLPFGSFLDSIARRTPTPGGGSVAAACGALSSAMARMVAAYSINAKTADDVRRPLETTLKQCARADILLRTLVTQDARAYQELSSAMKSAREDDGKAAGYQTALQGAIAVPMEMAAVASGLLDVMDQNKQRFNRRLISDVGVAAVLAEATARAAAYSVRVNAAELDDPVARERVLGEITRLCDRCRETTGVIENFVSDML